MSLLELRGVTKRFAPHLPPVLSNVSLSVREGELLTLLGPSGCGKTTTLRLVAGFERPDEGDILIGGATVAGSAWRPPEARRVGMVFQDYALFPHLTVLGNVMFGLRGNDRQRRARDVLNLVGLTVFEKRYPAQLSGGQQQRVALARALAPAPRLLLLDEPFSNLDAALRHGTRAELRAILRETRTTAVLVTHDQEEALAVSDRIAVMRGGAVEQIGTPEDVYATPATAFVAGFLGRGNLLSGVARGSTVSTVLGDVPLAEPASGPVLVMLRPEALAFAPDGAPVTILAREYKGHDATYNVRLGNLDLLVHHHGAHALREGDTARVKIDGVARVVR